MSGGLRHPFSGVLYTCMPDGRVRVEDGDEQGFFHPDGRWIAGELREADPQFCGWVAGDRFERRGLSS